jgi:hypothetical protein
MKINKKIGVYLNYQTAHIIEFANQPLETKTIESDFTHEDKLETLNKGEKTMHHKEQHEQAAYFKKISDAIRDYDEVVLFGPTKAKDELHNVLKADNHFAKIDFNVQKTDDMSEKEQEHFVNNFFSKKSNN